MDRSKTIQDLLPHRDPFLFVDKITSATQEEIIGTTIFSELNPFLKNTFPNHSSVPGTILIESMVQCGGAGVRLLGIANGTFALASIENAIFLHEVDYNKQITYTIKNLKISEKIIKQSGVALVHEIKVMEASWMTVKML